MNRIIYLCKHLNVIFVYFIDLRLNFNIYSSFFCISSMFFKHFNLSKYKFQIQIGYFIELNLIFIVQLIRVLEHVINNEIINGRFRKDLFYRLNELTYPVIVIWRRFVERKKEKGNAVQDT